MLSLNLSAPFLPSVLLYSVWKTYYSARKVSPFHFCFGRFHSVFLLPCCFVWVQLALGSAEERCLEEPCSVSCIQDFPGQESPINAERMLDLLAVECPHRSLGRAVPACVKWATVRPWLRECSLYAGNFTNYHYVTDLPISEEVTKEVVVWQLRLYLASSDFLDLSDWF